MNAADNNLSRREFLAQSVAGMAGKAKRLLIDTHLEVWTIDSTFPFHHPEHPDEKPEIGAPIENEVEVMRDYGLRYTVLINPRHYGWDNSYISYSLNKYPDRFVAHGLINPEDPKVVERLRFWMKEHVFRACSLARYIIQTQLGSIRRCSIRCGAKPNGWEWCSISSLPHQMPMLEDMAGRFSGVKVVVDHLGKPDLRGPDPWTDFRKMFRLKKFPQVWISASEPYEISLEGFPYRDTWPFFKVVYQEFGGSS